MTAEPHAVCVAAAQPNKANCTAVLHFPNTWGSIAGSAGGGGGGGDSSSPRDPFRLGSACFPRGHPEELAPRLPSPAQSPGPLERHSRHERGVAAEETRGEPRGYRPLHASATATDATNALSPAGSRYEPATPVWFHRLARYPSSQSEAPAATTAARINSGGASLTIPAAMSGPDAPRAMDRAFGIVAMSP